ncbi:MAG: FAD-dependent monooxygenase [Thermoanaerobaculia bacterium]
MRDVDVLIVGAGPAGATAALNLAPLRRVAIVERSAEPSPRIGESLPAAARRLFRDMGLLDSFLAQGHAPCYGNRSVWGDAQPRELDALRDPDGHGWHLDRVRFERWLRDAATARGATVIAPATIERIERDGDAWLVTCCHPERESRDPAAGRHEAPASIRTPTQVPRLTLGMTTMTIRASLIIDAAGRAAPIARRLGAQTRIDDRLVCGWVYGRDERHGSRGWTFVEATEDGWWYTAPMPHDRRVLAFHTDSDLPAARVARDRDALLQSARSTRKLASWLDDAGFVAEDAAGFTAAHSATLEPCAGDGFLAAGDAALAFDPLSSQGLLNALFTGLAAAEAADSHLRGDADAMSRYRDTISGIAAAYRRHLSIYYGMEERWPDALFWKRRRNC